MARPRAGSIPVAASAYEVIEVIEGVGPPESSTVLVVASPYPGVRFPAPRLMGAPVGVPLVSTGVALRVRVEGPHSG